MGAHSLDSNYLEEKRLEKHISS
jgi:hypothetical protein